MLPTLLLCLALQAPPAPPDPKSPDAARSDAIDADGVYVGVALGPDKARPPVTIELRGACLVISDETALALATIDAWKLAGPGGKGGDLVLQTRGHYQGSITRGGTWRPPARKAPTVTFRMRLWPERKAAMLCATDPMKKGAVIDRVPPLGADVSPPGTTCWEVAVVWQPSTPPPSTAPPEPDFECMRECRQQNMMRAVGPEVIEEDCRKACTQK